MQDHKLEIFRKENPTIEFPPYRKLGASECRIMEDKLARALGLNEDNDYTDVAREILSRRAGRESINMSNGFVLSRFLHQGERRPSKLFLDWSSFGKRMDDVDEMKTDDFERFFKDIFYEGADELLVFSVEGHLLILVDDSAHCTRII